MDQQEIIAALAEAKIGGHVQRGIAVRLLQGERLTRQSVGIGGHAVSDMARRLNDAGYPMAARELERKPGERFGRAPVEYRYVPDGDIPEDERLDGAKARSRSAHASAINQTRASKAAKPTGAHLPPMPNLFGSLTVTGIAMNAEGNVELQLRNDVGTYLTEVQSFRAAP